MNRQSERKRERAYTIVLSLGTEARSIEASLRLFGVNSFPLKMFDDRRLHAIILARIIV